MAKTTSTKSKIAERIQEIAAPQYTQYAGNIMYLNSNIRNPQEEYLTVMVRYANDDQIEEMIVGLYVPRGTCAALNAAVGDLVAFAALNIVEGNTTLGDGTPVNKAYKMSSEFGLQIVTRKARPVAVVATQKVQGDGGMATRLSELMDKLGGIFTK